MNILARRALPTGEKAGRDARRFELLRDVVAAQPTPCLRKKAMSTHALATEAAAIPSIHRWKGSNIDNDKELIKLAQKFKKIAKDKPVKQSKADKEKVRRRCQTRTKCAAHLLSSHAPIGTRILRRISEASGISAHTRLTTVCIYRERQLSTIRPTAATT